MAGDILAILPRVDVDKRLPCERNYNGLANAVNVLLVGTTRGQT